MSIMACEVSWRAKMAQAIGSTGCHWKHRAPQMCCCGSCGPDRMLEEAPLPFRHNHKRCCTTKRQKITGITSLNENRGSWAKMAYGLRCRRSITGPRPTFPSTSRPLLLLLSLTLSLSLLLSLTLSYSYSLLLSISYSLSLALSLSLSLSLSYSLTLLLSLSFSHSLILSFSLSLFLSFTLTLSLSLTLTHSLSLTHSLTCLLSYSLTLSLSHSLTLFPSFPLTLLPSYPLTLLLSLSLSLSHTLLLSCSPLAAIPLADADESCVHGALLYLSHLDHSATRKLMSFELKVSKILRPPSYLASFRIRLKSTSTSSGPSIPNLQPSPSHCNFFPKTVSSLR